MTSTSLYRRPLPAELIAFASPEGRALFREALDAGGLEGYFALAEQFHTQAEPAFCSLGTLVVALNALAIDPGRAWRGPWRWYSEELLDCCAPLDTVRREGLSLGQFVCLARCNGARVTWRRADEGTLEEFRAALAAACGRPAGAVVVAAYDRGALGQTGSGHYSPLAGYHAARDLALVLDVARFKYPPHWVPLATLWAAMDTVDPATSRRRGWAELRPGAPPTVACLRVQLAQGEWFALARAMHREVPAAFARAQPATLDAVVAALIAALPSAALVPGRVESALEELALEHRAHATRARDALVSSRVYTRVSAAPAAAPLDPLQRGLIALLLLACPQVARDALPAAARAELDALRAADAADPLLAPEAARLSEQLVALDEMRDAG